MDHSEPSPNFQAPSGLSQHKLRTSRGGQSAHDYYLVFPYLFWFIVVIPHLHGDKALGPLGFIKK